MVRLIRPGSHAVGLRGDMASLQRDLLLAFGATMLTMVGLLWGILG